MERSQADSPIPMNFVLPYVDFMHTIYLCTVTERRNHGPRLQLQTNKDVAKPPPIDHYPPNESPLSPLRLVQHEASFRHPLRSRRHVPAAENSHLFGLYYSKKNTVLLIGGSKASHFTLGPQVMRVCGVYIDA